MPAGTSGQRAWAGLTYEAGRLAILFLSLAATLFFLISLHYYVPGGAQHFIDWANILVSGGHANPGIAQRDIGYPLLLVLGGYPFTHSFVGITLINAVFAVLMPLLVYGIIGRERPALALFGALATILSAAPYVFMKMIHHDHAHMFFTLLTLYLGVNFLRRQSYPYLYLMTLAAIAASLTRPAGNLFFFVAIRFAAAAGGGPRRWHHYALCFLLFAAVAGSYALHRHQVGLDDPKDSYTGRQIFYNPYVNSREFGIRIWPGLGPATAQLVSSLRAGLTAHPIDSQFFQDWLAGQQIPEEAANRYFRGRTVEELVERVLTHPHYDLFELLCLFEPDDRVFRDAAIEIMTHYPLYPVDYTVRNLFLFFGTPGYAHPRYGLEDAGLVRLAGTRLVTKLFFTFATFVLISTSVLAVAGTFGAMFSSRDTRITCWFSAVVALYNGVIVGAFVDPAWRYHFSVLPEQIICAAFGGQMVWRLASRYRPKSWVSAARSVFAPKW
jgi:hypothetical protein